MRLPLSFDLKDRNILLVGGGKAALEKFVQLSRTSCRLTIISKSFSSDFQNALAQEHWATIEVHERGFGSQDVEGRFMVFSAVDDSELAEEIYQLCRKNNILINSADDTKRCDFFTTAIVERGSVQIAVSTGGRFAGLTRILRRHLESLFPDELDADWEKIFSLRTRALALQDMNEKKSVITNIVKQVESEYFSTKKELP